MSDSKPGLRTDGGENVAPAWNDYSECGAEIEAPHGPARCLKPEGHVGRHLSATATPGLAFHWEDEDG